jgi:ribulose-5-phosphate 4-epimerase/fuculose-1-phosphate aldolase
VLGKDRSVLFMGNHGVAVCGSSVAEAYDKLFYLERACQVQLYAMWTGKKLSTVPPKVVERTVKQYEDSPVYGNKPACEHHFDALKRMLDRTAPDYVD